jgi:hypothetical protein
MKRTVYFVEGTLQALIGVGAIICGALLVIAPDGRFLQMPLEMLKDSPFRNFLVPGLILLLVNGVGNTISAVLCFRLHRIAGITGMIFGFGLIIWIFIQVNMIGGGSWLQYLYFGLGILVLLVGIAMRETLLRSA